MSNFAIRCVSKLEVNCCCENANQVAVDENAQIIQNLVNQLSTQDNTNGNTGTDANQNILTLLGSTMPNNSASTENNSTSSTK